MRNRKLDERLQKRSIFDPLFQETYPEFIKQKIDLSIIDQRFAAMRDSCDVISNQETRRINRWQSNQCML